MPISEMRVFLDDQPCEVAGDTVVAAVAEAAELARATGRMIVEVIVDGQIWTSQQFDSPDHSECTASEVRLLSALPAELVRQTLVDAAGALNEAAALQQQAAELLQQDHVPQAMQRLQRAMAIWGSVQQALTMGASVASIDLNKTAPGMECSINQMIASLNDQLRMMRDELQRQDTVALADTLLYDFPPVIRRWQDLLTGLPVRLTE